MLQGKTIHLSFITELELIGFKHLNVTEEKRIHNLLNECEIIPLNNEIKKMYIAVRRNYNLKLADALIVATALASSLPLIIADKHFKTVKELSLVAYEL